jgi:endonuclease/exonuclease/phosphatase family metal-dependent hydrolase
VPGWSQWQLVKALRDLARIESPVVLMGDLNLRNPLPALLTGYRSLAGYPTFPAEAPTRQLDHILLRGALGRVLTSGAPLLPLSDHRALSADLSLSLKEVHP